MYTAVVQKISLTMLEREFYIMTQSAVAHDICGSVNSSTSTASPTSYNCVLCRFFVCSMCLLASNREARKRFIYSKYRDHVFCQMHPLHGDQAALDAVSVNHFLFFFRICRILEYQQASLLCMCPMNLILI